MKAIDNLCAIGRVEDDVVAQFESDWTKEQQLEIFALCGAYHTSQLRRQFRAIAQRTIRQRVSRRVAQSDIDEETRDSF